MGGDQACSDLFLQKSATITVAIASGIYRAAGISTVVVAALEVIVSSG